MALKITKEEYIKLIQEDMELIRKHIPDSPERDHINLVLCNSIDMHYPSDGYGDMCPACNIYRENKAYKYCPFCGQSTDE